MKEKYRKTHFFTSSPFHKITIANNHAAAQKKITGILSGYFSSLLAISMPNKLNFNGIGGVIHLIDNLIHIGDGANLQRLGQTIKV